MCTVGLSYDSREGKPKLCILSRPRSLLLVLSGTLFRSSLIAIFHQIRTETNESHDGSLYLQLFYLQLSYIGNKKSLKAAKITFTCYTSSEWARSLYPLMQVEIWRDLVLWHWLGYLHSQIHAAIRQRLESSARLTWQCTKARLTVFC